MNEFHLLPIDASFNSEMLSILKASPIKANGLELYFDKSPDIFGIPRLKYSSGEHVGFFGNGKLKGFASVGLYDAYINGKMEKVFTFYNFYLLPEARGNRLPEKAIKHFISGLRGKVSFGISVTMKGNRQAESYIGRQDEDWMPQSQVIDQLVVKSILFSFARKNNTLYKVRNACTEDIPDMVRLLHEENRHRIFGLPFDENGFLQSLGKRGLMIEDYYVATDKNGHVRGCCLAWDCSALRRTRVLSYSAGFYPFLAAYKALGIFLNIAPFPAKGEHFSELTITEYAVEKRDAAVMHALLSEIYYRFHTGKYHFMNFASCRSDKLLKAADGFWHRDIISHLVFMSLERERPAVQTNLPYIDIGFL